MQKIKRVIGVIGGAVCDEQAYETAYEVGRLIAKNNFVLMCGGFGGVMEAASKGARSEGGLTIGILPSDNAEDANPYIDIPVVTGMGIARNVIIVRSSDAIIAVDGKYGTLSEIAYALQLDKKVFGIDTWDISGVIQTSSPEEAVEKIIKMFSAE